MDFEWDPAKAASNAAKHGIPFEEAVAVFVAGDRRVVADERRAYGEARYIAYGSLRGSLLAVTFTVRGAAIRIISARAASRQERRRHHG